MKVHTMFLLMLGSAMPLLVHAQEIEPGVQTSSAAAPTQPAAPPAAQAPPAGHVQPAASRARSTAAPATGGPSAPPADKSMPPRVLGKSADRPVGKSSDRIQLDTTEISGNQELPKVMYVVPWRRADPGEFAGRPPNSLLDEALTPVDRDVFKRQNRYYGALQGQSQATTAAPASKDEK